MRVGAVVVVVVSVALVKVAVLRAERAAAATIGRVVGHAGPAPGCRSGAAHLACDADRLVGRQEDAGLVGDANRHVRVPIGRTVRAISG
jgi:hypothetical protein